MGEFRQFQIPIEQLSMLCHRWNITRLELFGSAVRDDFTDQSDLDLLITFREGCSPDFFEFSRIRTELETVFGRSIDILTRKAVENSRNPIRKKEILTSARTIYDEAA